MAQIIRFPVKAQAASSGYDNLSRLIAVAATKEVLNFYVESIEQLEKSGKLLDGEAQKLTEQGREKRLEMAKPDPIEKEVAEAPGVYCYTPEMGGQKPECQMEASRGYYGKHWFIDTPLKVLDMVQESYEEYEHKKVFKTGLSTFKTFQMPEDREVQARASFGLYFYMYGAEKVVR